MASNPQPCPQRLPSDYHIIKRRESERRRADLESGVRQVNRYTDVARWENKSATAADRQRVRRSSLDLDDPKLLGKSNIPDNLDAMVTILIREDWGLIRDTNNYSTTTSVSREKKSHGPLKACLEYTLENRVFIDLCAKGLADRPRGMMSLILVTVHRIIEKVRHPLLPYKSAHQPLCQLIRVSAEVGNSNARERLVALLKTLWFKMRQDPSQLQFFYSSAHGSEKLDMFLALLPHALQQSECGERARYALLCVSSICDTSLQGYVADHTVFCEQVSNGLDGAFRALLAAKAALADLASSAGDDQALDQEQNKQAQRDLLGVSEELQFTVKTAEESLALCWQFANAVSIPSVTIGLGAKDLEVGADSSYRILSNKLVEHVREHFFLATLVPALMATGEAAARDAILCVCSMLRSMGQSGLALQSPLLWALVSIMVSGDPGPDDRPLGEQGLEPTEGSLCRKLQSNLLFRIDSMAPDLSAAALRLFVALLDLNDPRILHSLVLRQLYPGRHLTTTPKSRPESSTAQDFKTPTKPKARRGRSGPSAVQFLEMYPGSPRPPSFKQVKVGGKRKLTSEEQVDLVAFEAYLTDGQRQAAAKIAAFASQVSATHAKEVTPRKKPSSTGGDSSNVMAQQSEGAFTEGWFLALVFNKLERMLDSSLAENLVLTAILSKLAQYPHPVLNSYLFEDSIAAADFQEAFSSSAAPPSNYSAATKSNEYLYIKSGLRSLSSVLASVWKEAKERSQDLDASFDPLYRMTRYRLGVDEILLPSKDGALDDEEEDLDAYPLAKQRFVQAYVVVEEFLKELASVIQAKQNLSSFAQDLAT